MSISSTVSIAKERETSITPVSAEASPGKLSATVERNINDVGTTGTFVYLKARRGMKNSPARKANEDGGQ